LHQRQPRAAHPADAPPRAGGRQPGRHRRPAAARSAGPPIDMLTRALDTTSVPVEALPGALVDAVLAAEPDDDVAILVAEAGPHRGFTEPITLVPTAVARARSCTREVLA